MANKPFELQATGAPAQAQLQVPNAPQPALSFSPAPAQPGGSDLLSILANIASIGTNIAAASMGKAPVGGGLMQFAQQQAAQAADNKRESQRIKELETEAEAVVKRAKAQGLSGTALEQIQVLAQNRQVPQARQELDRELYLLRQRGQEAKQEKEFLLREASARSRELEKEVAAHPAARAAIVRDAISKLPPETLKDNAKLQIALTGLKGPDGKRLFAGDRDVKNAVRTVRKAFEESQPSSGFFGLGAREGRDLTKVFAEKFGDEAALGDFDSRNAQLKELKEAANLLRSKPGSERSKQGKALLEKYLAGAPVEQAQPAAPAAPPPSGPKPGDVVKGYRFKGGDPSKKENWEKAN